MACSNTNLLVNRGFQTGLSPWTGTNIKRVKSPIDPTQFAVLMNNPTGQVRTTLKQVVPLTIEPGCAYYLYFQVLNTTTGSQPANLFGTVAYLDAQQRIIRSTPLQVQPPKATSLKRFKYFDIVPPPPHNTRFVSVSFLLGNGTLFVGYVRLVAHSV